MYFLDHKLQAGLPPNGAVQPPIPASATAGIPGTCGEFLQGRFAGRDVLLSCPVDRYVRAQIQLIAGSRVTGLEAAPRALAVLADVLRRHGDDGVGAHVHLDSPLPRGKGMASSTADICAVAGAALLALDQTPDPTRLAELATAMEPSDGIMHPGLVLMDRHSGRVLEHYPAPPRFTLLALDAGGEIETLGFHRPEHERIRVQQAGAFADAVAATREGLQNGCAATLASGSTLSARLNQSILPNPLLAQAEREGRQLGAHGVCIAHSGTIVGLIMPPDADRVASALARLRARFGPRVSIETLTPVAGGLVSGGFRG